MDKVVSSLNNVSKTQANEVNDIINTINTDINKNIFKWVNITITAVNLTLSEFVDQIMGALNTIFGGTILYNPIIGVLNCLILLKL